MPQISCAFGIAFGAKGRESPMLNLKALFGDAHFLSQMAMLFEKRNSLCFPAIYT
jgi:hypothetical protein